jgi:hypothetical protein
MLGIRFRKNRYSHHAIAAEFHCRLYKHTYAIQKSETCSLWTECWTCVGFAIATAAAAAAAAVVPATIAFADRFISVLAHHT